MGGERSTGLGTNRGLLLFCRAPVPGAAKTRLTPPLDPAAAAALSLAMLLDTVETLDATGIPMEVRVASESDVGPVRGLIPHAQVEAQGKGDLGARMARAVEELFTGGADAAAIVGSDCPGLTPGHVASAFGALDQGADAAVCPSADGGYGLIALSAPHRTLFEGIPWSTGAVLARSRAAAEAAGIELARVEPLDDVDRPEDLVGLEARLAARPAAPRTRHVLAALGVA